MPTSGPASIQIDASLNCQLACPLCPTADGRVKPALGGGHLKLADFEALLDLNPQVAHVELSNYGEMFLNPQLADILACAFEHKVTVTGNNGVNLNFAREDALEAVVRYRVQGLKVSIDGATQESYSRYRVNGNLSRVLANIDAIRRLREKHKTAFPLLQWQFVVFGHNEHEIKMARTMATERGMAFFPKLSWDAEYSPVRNQELVRIESGLGASNRGEYLEQRGADYTRDICTQLWHAPVLNWNGTILGCCVNYWGDFGGNAFKSSLPEVLASPKMNYARNMLTGKAEARPDIPCSTCSQYAGIRDSAGWLTEAEIEERRGLRHIAGIVLHADPSIKFAQVIVCRGTNKRPVWRASGRLFRFGVDHAVYFSPPTPGAYTVFARALGPTGWMPVVGLPLEIESRPLCQGFMLDLSQPTVLTQPDESIECLALRIL